MGKKTLTFHLFQFSPVSGEPLKTLKNLQKMLTGWAPKKGDWLVFPEMWPSGFDPKDISKQKVENAFCFHWLKRFARKHRCYLTGAMLELPKKKPFISAYVINPEGKLIDRYRKIHLFRYSGEDRKYKPGNQLKVFKMDWGKLGMAICYDLRFPEQFRALTKKGAEVILIPSAWPEERIDHWRTLLKARAIENQCFIVGVNKFGKEKKGRVYGGYSAVYDPWGNRLGQLGKRRGKLTVKINLLEVGKVRKKYPFLKDKVNFGD